MKDQYGDKGQALITRPSAIPSVQSLAKAATYNLELKHQSKIGRTCRFCGTKFDAKRWHQVFCCPDHRVKYFWAHHEVVEKVV